MTDRDVTTTDKKQKSIRFDESPYTDARLPVPEVHDEPYQYHKINLAWRAIIFGWLHILASVRGFLDAEDEDHRGIQSVLKFLTPVPANEINYPVSAFDDCVEYGTYNDATSFTPNNPFTPGADYEPSLLELKWVRLGDILSPEFLPDWLEIAIDNLGETAGYLNDDIFLILDARDVFQWTRIADMFNAITSLNVFPSITINLDGAGIVQLKFLNVPLGGSVLIYWDIEPTLEQIYDIIFNGEIFSNFILNELNRDLLALPPETISTRISEIVFEDDGAHEIKCLFIPRFDDSLPFVFPFGGFRELQVCDGIEVIGVSTGTKTRPDIYRQDVFMATLDELKEAGIWVWEEVARRILFAQDKDNILSNLEVDKDTGKLTLVQADIDRDDIDGTTQEKRYGGVYNQALQIKTLFEDINDYMDIPYANPTIFKLTKSFVDIDAIDDPTLSADWDTAVGAYITADPDLVIDVDALALQLFCNSISSGTTNYAIDDEAYSEANLNLFTDILVLIPKSTYSLWYKDGSYTPLDGYQSASCYRFPDAVITYGTNDLTSTQKLFTAQPNIPPGSTVNDRRRAFRVEITGILTGDNYQWDGMFLKALPSGVPVYDPLILRRLEGGVNINGTYTPVISPPYQVAGDYEVTTIVGGVTPNTVALGAISVPPEIQSDTGVTGIITIVCKDLGHPDG